MHLIRLIGIVIIVIGFVMKLDTIAVVLLAGLATALVSGISVMEFLALLGNAFVSNRLVTIFFLTLPMIGLAERFGLRQQATRIIERIEQLTPGRFMSLYMVIREIAGVFGIRIQGHPQFVRPLVEPMAQAAAESEFGDIEKKDQEKLKARSAAMENLGNFYAQNTFIAAAGVLLISGTLDSLGYKVSQIDIVKASIPVAIIALLLALVSNYWLDKKMQKKYGNKDSSTPSKKGGK